MVDKLPIYASLKAYGSFPKAISDIFCRGASQAAPSPSLTVDRPCLMPGAVQVVGLRVVQFRASGNEGLVRFRV